jgi:hypothetical protein
MGRIMVLHFRCDDLVMMRGELELERIETS